MSLYERLLKEKEEEEQRRGRPLGRFRSLDSRVLERKVDTIPSDSSHYVADLGFLRRYLYRGPTNAGEGMRYMSLKQRHPDAYRDLAVEARGQGELF